ncbi:hypothetical protein GGH18_002262 [Coemansia sp. RSA 530]|nr:hypothetical protein GGH18_002262 [Coemansia sp. RSA 530]
MPLCVASGCCRCSGCALDVLTQCGHPPPLQLVCLTCCLLKRQRLGCRLACQPLPPDSRISAHHGNARSHWWQPTGCWRPPPLRVVLPSRYLAQCVWRHREPLGLVGLNKLRPDHRLDLF